MLDFAFQFFDKLATDFTKRRIVLLIVMIAMVIGSVFIYESYTSNWRLKKLERATNLLIQLQSINDKQELHNDNNLRITYNIIRQNLEDIIKTSTTTPQIPPIYWRVLMGAAPWLLFSLLFIPNIRRGESGAFAGVIGAIFTGCIFGGAAILLPESLGAAFHYVIYPIGHFIIVMLIVLAIQARRKKTA